MLEVGDALDDGQPALDNEQLVVAADAAQTWGGGDDGQVVDD